MLSSYKSDIVWTSNEYLKYILQRDFAVSKVQVINPLFEDTLIEKMSLKLQQVEQRKSFRGSLRFDGDFSEEYERENLEYFLNSIWPQVSDRLPGVNLDVFGISLDSRLLQLCMKHRKVRPVVDSIDQGKITLSESTANYRPKHIANITSLLYPGLSRW